MTRKIYRANPNRTLAQKVATEAERRIKNGILVDGKKFRCDDRSVGRMGEIHGVLDAGAIPEATFKTTAGDMFTLDGAADALSILNAQKAHRLAVMGASAVLQDKADKDELPANWLDDEFWPALTEVTLS